MVNNLWEDVKIKHEFYVKTVQLYATVYSTEYLRSAVIPRQKRISRNPFKTNHVCMTHSRSHLPERSFSVTKVANWSQFTLKFYPFYLLLVISQVHNNSHEMLMHN